MRVQTYSYKMAPCSQFAYCKRCERYIIYASDDDWDKFDLEGTKHDTSVLQETSQIRGSCQARKNTSGRAFSQSSKGAIDVINAFKAYFNGPTAAILSQNQ